eukprot:Pgem_evm1s20234
MPPKKSKVKDKIAEFFDYETVANHAICKLCKNNNVIKQLRVTAGNSSNHRAHLQNTHPIAFAQAFNPHTIVPPEVQVSRTVCGDFIWGVCNFIINEKKPFSIVEKESFREKFNYCIPPCNI